MLGEFELIRRYLAPLAADEPAALGLIDDAAVLAAPPGRDLVLTADAMVAGVHYLAEDPPDLVARKLLRVNLSDLAAMGATPRGYLLTACWPQDVEEHWIAQFVEGLAADQAAFGIRLLGGDTTRTPGPASLSLTALGTVPAGRCLRRSTARAGDLVYVSGTIGDGALGLAALQDRLAGLSAGARHFLAERYRLPQPRVALGEALLAERLATAALDVSDGLAADLAHIAETSGLAAQLEAAAVPLSPAARAALKADPELLASVLTGGDDYELVFTVEPAQAEAVAALAGRLALQLTRIGVMEAGEGVQVLDAAGVPMALGKSGWTHF
ncbi:MAG: thiamine-phosphate kinase [Kiloniellales bacterium]